MKISSLQPVFVQYMPEIKEDGFLYISKEFELAIHLCACGCKDEVVTPLGSSGWTYEENGELVTLSPSIGNWRFQCRSHYFVRSNQIIWC